jgi:hypothetical protein
VRCLIVTLEDAKGFLKVDSDNEDTDIQDLIDGAEEFLKNATGKTFDATNKLAKLVVRILITDWHENPNNIGRADHIFSQIQCYLTQLTYCYPAAATEAAP